MRAPSTREVRHKVVQEEGGHPVLTELFHHTWGKNNLLKSRAAFFQPFGGNDRNWIFRNLEFSEKFLEFSKKILEFSGKILEFTEN